MSMVIYIIVAIFMFGVLIAIHEFGHFITAKLLGVKVNEFAIGMGPRLLHRQKGETEYTLRAFPIGGFCAMEGEDGDSQDPRSFQNKPAWKRFIVLLAGSLMNFLTGVLIFLVLYSGTGAYISTTIAGFADGFTAQGQQGLMVGDRVVEIDGHPIWLMSDVALFFDRGDDTYLDITVVRDGERVELEGLYMPWIVTQNADGTQSAKRGVTFAVKEAGVLDRLQLAWYNTIDTVRLVWMSLGDLFSGAVGLRDMSGPIGIVSMIGQEATQAQEEAQATGGNAVAAAATTIFYIVAFIAINLSVMNLLPIPALDGGQLFFLLVDKVYSLFTRRRINPKYLGYINAAGMICLLALMAVVALSDVFKQFGH